MKKVELNNQRNIVGGSHSHWICAPHGYTSVARTAASAQKYGHKHNVDNHGGKKVAYVRGGCTKKSGRCSKIYQ